MSELEVVKHTQNGPVTVESLVEDFRDLGVKPGLTLLVHSSLSPLGWVCGGRVAVILALEQILTPDGNLVMPAHSTTFSEPSLWQNPPVPEDWWESIRSTMPAYEPDLTPTRKMGAIAESFRKQNGVLRSGHPQFSFTAWGAEKAFVTGEHALEFGMGENSSLARVYDLEGWVLLLGVGHINNSSLHLAENRAHYPGNQNTTNGSAILVNGKRTWVTIKGLDMDESDFEEIADAFERKTGLVRRSKVGDADAVLFPQRALIDFAVASMGENRNVMSKE
ncbi:MAG: SPBc2 prophage-derived aminoglycoside N(3')-acetyltransferase-like protein YokD [Chloroflexi bacterium]|nr:SPBc2 prophage-derived aminoglycoside N(3')-acetyltransferase-like protein YokD [Chloroflexota bacterium]